MSEPDRANWLSNQPVQSKMMLGLGLVLAVFVAGTVAALADRLIVMPAKAGIQSGFPLTRE